MTVFKVVFLRFGRAILVGLWGLAVVHVGREVLEDKREPLGCLDSEDFVVERSEV